MTPRLVLASASPARLRLLQDAGLAPDVVVSGVNEDELTAALRATPAQLSQELATAKARTVAAGLADEAPEGAVLVVGCDSVLELDGRALGKPADAAEAALRWQEMSGRTGTLHTGHHAIRLDTQTEIAAVGSTRVTFAEPTAAEIDAYVASGEPLRVAGGFTLDGLGGAFVEQVVGDPSNVVGLSLPLLRQMVGRLGVEWTDLWARRT